MTTFSFLCLTITFVLLTHIPHEQDDPAEVKIKGQRAKLLMLPMGVLHGKHAVQCGIWVPTQHLLWDQGKP
jgi:hypothetical protein